MTHTCELLIATADGKFASIRSRDLFRCGRPAHFRLDGEDGPGTGPWLCAMHWDAEQAMLRYELENERP